MVQLKANLEKEGNFSENGAPKREVDLVQYSPLPDEGGTQAQNKVVVSLVAPARWKMFNPTGQDIEKFGLVPSHVFGGDMEWGSLYFQLPSHRVPNFQYPNGNTGFAHSLCPLALNKYLVEGLELAPLFDTPVRCAYCEEKERLWDAHNDAWKSLGIDKSELSKDGYFAAMKEHDLLSQTREAARNMTASEKYVVSVFDHDRFLLKRPLAEGQTVATWQSWYAPNKIYEGLRGLHKGLSDAGMPPFFDMENPQGVHILTMVKDTTGWTKTSRLKTEYTVQNLGERYAYSPEWVAYLKNDVNYADPSSYIHMLSYEEQRFYIEQAGEKKSYNRERKTTVDVGAQPLPPTQMAPPTAATVSGVPAQAVVPQPAPAPAPAPVAQVPPTAPPASAAQAAPVPQPVTLAGPPVPTLPTAAPVAAAPPASPAPVVGGAPIPDRVPPVGGPPVVTGRVNWD